MRRLGAAALAFLLLAGCGEGAWMGVNISGPLQNAEVRRADVHRVADTGAGWVRVFVPWNEIDDGPGRYHWADIDTQIDTAEARSMRILATLTGTAEWARPPGTGPRHYPSDPDTYARFALDFQRRHHADVLQLGNEPDLLSHSDDLRPEALAPVLRTTVYTLRAGGVQAPIMFPTLSPTDPSPVAYGQREFLARSLELGLGDLVQQYGVNVYSIPNVFSTSYAPVRLGLIRQIIDVYDDPAKLLWPTEYGSPAGLCQGCVGGPGVQALHLADFFLTYQNLRGPWKLGPALWYGSRDWGPVEDWNGSLGLIPRITDANPDPAPRQSYATFDDLAR